MQQSPGLSVMDKDVQLGEIKSDKFEVIIT